MVIQIILDEKAYEILKKIPDHYQRSLIYFAKLTQFSYVIVYYLYICYWSLKLFLFYSKLIMLLNLWIIILMMLITMKIQESGKNYFSNNSSNS